MKNDIKIIRRLLESKEETIESIKQDLLKELEKAENTLKHIDFSDSDTATKELKKREAENDIVRLKYQLEKIDRKLDYESQKQKLTDYKFERAYDKLEQESIIEDFKSLIIDDINNFKKHYSLIDIFSSLSTSENIENYIKQLKHDYNYKTRNDYTELFYRAFNSIRKLYNQDLTNERILLRQRVQKRRQKTVNSLFLAGTITVLDRWVNRREKRW